MTWSKEQQKQYSREGCSWWWKGGDIIWGKYEWLRKPAHPRARNGYVPKHRFIMEQVLKRFLRDDEFVHHNDGNPLNNRFYNLQIVTANEHARIHKGTYSPLNGWLRLFMKIVW